MKRLIAIILLVLMPSLSAAYTSTDYISKVQSIKTGYLDTLWNGSTGQYESNNGYGVLPYTWLNAFMVEVTAILAGHGQATATDITRANTVIAKLISSPCYSNYTWTHLMDGSSDTHEAVDQPLAEALYFAWKYRTQLGLDSGTISTIYNILTVNRSVSLYGGYNLQIGNAADNQNLAKWLLNRMTYAKLAGGSVDSQINATINKFASYIDQPFGSTNTGGNTLSELFPDYGWRYIDTMNMWPSLEYGSMSLGGMMLFYPEISSAAALSDNAKAKLKGWQRHIYGTWTRSGYPNWDTVYSQGRIHTLSYWLWSLRSLVGMVRATDLDSDSNTPLYAKWILDQALDTYTRMDTWNSDPTDSAVSKAPLGIDMPSNAFGVIYNNTKASSNAKLAMEAMVAVDLGVADAASADPGNMWGWNWTSQDVHVSTPAYSAASVPYAPNVGLGSTGYAADSVQGPGDGVSRIALPTGEILTNMGGYDTEAFSFKVTRNGSTEVNTGSISAGKPTSQQVWRDGTLQSRVNYDTTAIPLNFSSSLRSLVTRNGTNYRSEADTTFYPDHISQTYRAVLTGSAGTGQVLHSFPCRKNVVIDYVATGGTKTVVWDGATANVAGSPTDAKYIHLKWASVPGSHVAAGLLLVPKGGAVASGAKVTVTSTASSSYPMRQPDQDRSLLVYLADSAASMGSVDLTYDIWVTDGTDAGAASVYAASYITRHLRTFGHGLRTVAGKLRVR